MLILSNKTYSVVNHCEFVKKRERHLMTCQTKERNRATVDYRYLAASIAVIGFSIFIRCVWLKMTHMKNKETHRL